MNNDFENEASRAQKLAKRRKTNLILNSLITIVLLLIVFVTVKIFFGDSQSEAEKANTSVVVNKEVADKDVNVDSGNDEEKTKEVVDETPEGETETESEAEDTPHSDPIVTEGGDSPDVKQTIIDPNWQPVGTSQTGEHVAVYDETSIDWKEMLQALSQASGIAVDDMTVWHLGNNGSPQRAVGTVSGKGGGVKYRVSIDWVDGKGWKPVKLEELKLEE